MHCRLFSCEKPSEYYLETAKIASLSLLGVIIPLSAGFGAGAAAPGVCELLNATASNLSCNPVVAGFGTTGLFFAVEVISLACWAIKKEHEPHFTELGFSDDDTEGELLLETDESTEEEDNNKEEEEKSDNDEIPLRNLKVG